MTWEKKGSMLYTRKGAGTEEMSQEWERGITAGFDSSTGRWRDINGRYTTREKAVVSLQEELTALGGVLSSGRDRLSRAAEKIEHYIAGAGGFTPFDYKDLGTGAGRDLTGLTIPGEVLAAYNLADWYYQSEGDISAAVETPVMTSMRALDVRCPDSGVRAELEAMYDVDGVDLVGLAQGCWLSQAVFGIAYPFEIWDADELRGILLLPPKFVSIGTAQNTLLWPLDGSGKWTEQALAAQLPEAMYRGFPRRNVEIAPAGFIPLPTGAVHPVRMLDHRWKLYPRSFLSGAFRALSTRLVYEEMRRAVIEGFRHQLWLFLLGDKDLRPTPGMMSKLKSDIDETSRERTGNLAWWGALRVEILAPRTDTLLGWEEWASLSIDIFRRLGINMRAATGNTFSGGDRTGSDFDLDVSLMLEKFEWMRSRIMAWERRFRLRYAKKRGVAFEKAARETDVVFSASMLELEKLIERKLIPIFNVGALSRRSLLTQADQNYEAELANKKEELRDQELWAPPETFRQGVVNESGDEQVTREIGPQPGRPPDISAALADDAEKRKRDYLILLLALLHDHGSNPDEFVRQLMVLNRKELQEFARMGYRRAGGMHADVPQPWLDAAGGFVNSYASGFGDAMASGTGTMSYERRVLMYGENGYMMAIVHGIQAAMLERRATHWRRVLHPEASKAGPCALCIADSKVVHSVDEPFQILHPNDVCTLAPISLRFTGTGGSVEYGIPGITENEISRFLQEVGIPHEDNIRRAT